MSAATAPRKHVRLIGKHALLSVLGGLAMVLAMTGAVDAYWTAGGIGTGTGPVGTLAATSQPSGTPGAGTVALIWAAVTPPGSGSVSYYVQRDGDAVGGCQALVGTTCTDSGLSAGTYNYTVTAVWQSWTSTSAPVQVTLASGALASFTIPTPATQTAGTQFPISITAVDAAGNTVTGYTGSQCLDFSGPAASPSGTAPSYPAQGSCAGGQSAVTFTSGVAATVPVTLYNAAWTTITVTGSGKVGSTGAFTVNPLGASSLRLTAETTAPTAGVADLLTITALDQYGNTATSYAGSQNLTFSGAGMAGTTHPTVTNSSGTAIAFGTATAITFANGVSTLGGVMTLYKAETANISATGGGLTTNALWVTVSTGALASFTIPTPAAQTAGTPFSISITAKDAYGNTATGYTGSQCLTLSGPGASPNGTVPTYPAQGSCAAGQSAVTFTNGVAATVPVTLYNPSTSTILTATDAPSGRSGSTGAFTVNAAAVASFTMSTPAAQTAGTPFSISITAKDAYGNTATGYTGSQCLTLSGPGASPNGTVPTYPAQGSCAAGQSAVTFTNGVAATVPVTLNNASTSTVITATDAPSGRSGSTGAFTVNAAGTAGYSLTDTSGNPLGSQTAGTAFSVRLAAVDAYGNVTSSYSGTKAITWSGPGTVPGYPPIYPATVTFTSGVGTATGITLYKAETPTLQALDSGAPTIKGTASFTVNAAAANKLSFTQSPSTTSADNALSPQPKVTVQDQFGNTVTGDSSTVTLTIKTLTPTGGGPGSLTGCSQSESNGVVTFSGCKITTVGTGYQLHATDGTLTPADSTAFNITPGALDSFTIPTPTTRTAGTAFSVSLTAKDAYGNTVTGYTGNGKCIAFSGPANSPDGHVTTYPAQGSCAAGQSSVNFTNGVAATVNITLYNATPSTLFPSAQTTLTATDVPTGKSGSTNPFNVNGTNVATRFVILPATTTPTAGQADNLTIIIGDPYGNPTTYTGNYTLRFLGANSSPNGNAPTVTNNVGTAIAFGNAAVNNTVITFTNGVSTAGGVMRLYRVETANLTVRRSNGTYQSNAVAVTVRPAPVTAFTVANPAAQTAGTAFNLSITATDTYGNANVGTRCLIFSGPANGPDGTPPSYPAQGSCAAGQSEVVFTAAPTLVPVTLYRAGATTITVTDVVSGFTRTTTSFTVNPAAIDHFSMTAATITPIAGATDNLTITAFDPYGNTPTGYTGSTNHNLTFSGAGSIGTYNPTVTNNAGTATAFGTATAITFTNGVATVSGSANGVMRLYKAETANIVVSDGTHNNGAGLQVTVGAAAINKLSLSAEKVLVTAGAPDNLTITALDLYGNTATGYTGSHNLTFAGANLSGTVHPTVTNSSGTATNFGVATAINFANGVATVSGTANGVMRLYKIERAGITVAEGGAYTSDPLYVAVSATAIAVSAGAFHTCALMPSGGVECWGNNDYGQLGDNTTTDRSTPIIVSGITNAIQITSGKYHTCALLADHTIRCWGWNTYGQLGDNTTTDRHTPVQVSAITTAVEVSAEGGITCALLSAGTVYCWGHNAYGQLGNGLSGEANNSSTPVQVSGITGATLVFTGANHACALLSAGSVYCWGLNDNGQLGDNTTTARSTPVQVHGVGNVGMLTGVASLNAGRFHTCVVLTTGHVDCWGYNNYGQVGDNTTTDRLTPVEAGGITTATDVTGGAYHTCVRLADGTGRCWGRNDQGQLGDGTTAQRMSPVAIVGVDGTGILGGIADISAGGGNGTGDYEHTCVLTSDQTVYCWGYNNYGQVGDTTTTTRLYPVGVALQ